MKAFKKLASFILGICLGINIIPNVLAGGNGEKEVVTVLVVGLEESQRKFSRILFGEEKFLGQCYEIDCGEKGSIMFAMTLNYESNEVELGESIKQNSIKGTENHFKVILATVDADTDIEKVKQNMHNVVDYICDYKSPFTQVLIVGCTDKEHIDDFFGELANYTVSIERDGDRHGWGRKKDKSRLFNTGQFLGFHPFNVESKLNHEFYNCIFNSVSDYDFHKKHTTSQNDQKNQDDIRQQGSCSIC